MSDRFLNPLRTTRLHRSWDFGNLRSWRWDGFAGVKDDQTMQRRSCIDNDNTQDDNELQDQDVPHLAGEGGMRSPSMRLCSRTCGAEVGAGRCPWQSHGGIQPQGGGDVGG